MKKIRIIVLALVLSLLLTACVSEQASPKNFSLEPFEAIVTAESESISVSGKLKYTSSRDIIFEFTLPENISGVVLKKQGDIITAVKGNTQTELKSTNILTKEKNIFENLFEILDSLSTSSFEIQTQNHPSFSKNYIYGTFTAFTDPSTNKLSRVETAKITYIFTYN